MNNHLSDQDAVSNIKLNDDEDVLMTENVKENHPDDTNMVNNDEMISDPTVIFLESIVSETIREHVTDLLTQSPNTTDSDDSNLDDKKSDSLSTSQTDEFEIVLRELVLTELQVLTSSPSLLKSNAEVESETKNSLTNICTLWNDSVRVCYHMVSCQKQYQEQQSQFGKWSYRYINCNSLRKLPIVLLEDVVDVMSIEHVVLFWTNTIQQQPIRSTLFSSILWYESNVASLPFLKVGNKLWKRLTSSTTLYPSINNNNNSTTSMGVVQEQIDEISADVMLILSTVYPISEKSAVRPWGNYNADHTASIDNESTFQDEKQQDVEDDDVGGSIDNSATKVNRSKNNNGSSTKFGYQSYTLYSKFWLLQQDLCSPNKLVSVGDFLQRLQFVLPALENYSLRYQQDSNGDSACSSSLVAPFVTSSRIFDIQLSDPTVRIQLLTQYCIVVHHLLYTMPTIGAQAEAYQSLTTKLLQQASELVVSATNEKTTNNANDARPSYSYVNILNSILQQSETQWRTWKRIQKCSPSVMLEDRVDMYAKYQQQQQLADAPNSKAGAPASSSWISSTSILSKKRKWIETSVSNDNVSYKMVSIGDTTKISESMSIAIPTYEQHLEDYVEALDPEAGIDDEYHPKRNTTFTWQALRLLSNDMIPNFHRINPNGDFENLVRYVYATYKDTIIPGIEPELYEWVESDDEKDTDVVTSSNDNDVGDHDHEEIEEEQEEAASVNKENGERNDTDDGDDIESHVGNRTPMEGEENAVADDTAVKSPIDKNVSDENTGIENSRDQDTEKDNYKSEGETEEHPDEEDVIMEVTNKTQSDAQKESNQVHEENIDVSLDKNERVSTNDNSHKRKRGMESNSQTAEKARNDRPLGPHTKSSATEHVSNRKNDSSHSNHFSNNSKASAHRMNNNNNSNSEKTSTAWNHGPSEYASVARDGGDGSRLREIHQPWPRQQPVISNPGTTAKSNQGDRRVQDRMYHTDPVSTDNRRTGVVGIRGATDTSAFDTGRRGPNRDHPDDRRGVVDDDRYDHRRDHRGGATGGVDSRRSGIGGLVDHTTVGNTVRQSDDRNGRGPTNMNNHTGRSRDEFPSRNEDWRTSDRGSGGGGNASRRGGGGGGGRY
jgi:THO complex subunit 1